MNVTVSRPRRLLALTEDILELLGLVLFVPLTILAIGTPIAVVGWLLLALLHRF